MTDMERRGRATEAFFGRRKGKALREHQAETLNILRSSGLPISKQQCYREFSLEEPETEDDALPLPAPPQATDTGDPSGGVPAPSSPAPKSNA